MSREAYVTDLSDAQWAIVEPLIPPAKPGGRPRKTDMREVINTLLYLDRTGCQWGMLPHDLLPKSTVYEYFSTWRDDGTWTVMLTTLREQLRQQDAPSGEKSPSVAAIDSQSVKTAGSGGDSGYDGGKKITGRKRHIVVDTLGLILSVCVTAASVDDAAAAPEVLASMDATSQPRLVRIDADNKYHNHKLNRWIGDQKPQWELSIVRRPKGAKGFVLLQRRWVVERSFAWLMRHRRHGRDHERRTDSSEAMVQVAGISQMLNRLRPDDRYPPFKYGLAT